MANEEMFSYVEGAAGMTDIDLERQEYLEETQLESMQFSVGRGMGEFDA